MESQKVNVRVLIVDYVIATWGTIKKLDFSTPFGDSSWHALPILPKLADILA